MDISIEEKLSFLDARIKIAKDHISFYKKIASEKSYMHRELAILESLKESLLELKKKRDETKKD